MFAAGRPRVCFRFSTEGPLVLAGVHAVGDLLIIITTIIIIIIIIIIICAAIRILINTVIKC